MEDPYTNHPTLSQVPVAQLTMGMFVMELDRPWLGTPFLIQGFLLEDEQQLIDLRAHCKSVVIDRTRSVGDAHRSAPAAPQAAGKTPVRPAARAEEVPAKAEAMDDDALFETFRAIGRSSSTRRTGPVPKVNPIDNNSQFEEELVYSAPLVEDVLTTLRNLRTPPLDVVGGFEVVAGLVGEMAGAVERNPDALMWLTKLKATDEYSYDHALDVSVHLMIFGRFIGLSSLEVEELGLAGLMQDLGKIHIPPEILNKPEALSEAEYELVKAHVASSLEILLTKGHFSRRVLEIVANHHERQDGSGYPRNLVGAKIPLHCEASGMIDTYCAMIRDRPYEVAVSSQGALESLIKMRGHKFREALVDQFIQCLGIYPVGSLVELNSGEVAVVIQQNRVRRLLPRLLVLLGPDKTMARHPRSMDLMQHPKNPLGEPYKIVASLPKNAYGIDPKDLFL